MLTASDLTLLSRIFALKIQQRIDQLDSPSSLAFSCAIAQSSPTQLIKQEQIVVEKYKDYTTDNAKEIRLIRKFIERIIGIYTYFKEKSQSRNLLTVIGQKINEQFSAFLGRGPLQIGKIFEYVRQISAKGSIIKLPAERKRMYSKSTLKSIKNNQVKPVSLISSVQRRPISMLSYSKIQHTPKTPAHAPFDRVKFQSVLQLNYSPIQFQSKHLIKLATSSQDMLLRQMMKRNEKQGEQIRRYEKSYGRCKTQADKVQTSKDTPLAELRNNSVIKGWLCRKRKGNSIMQKYQRGRRNLTHFKQNSTSQA